jgi:ABC-2 type transport system permease protein
VTRLFATELLKVTSTRTVYWLLGALLLVVAIGNVAAILTASPSALSGEENQADMFAAAASGIILVLLLGVMLMTGEFRHGTITQTLLITPRRWKVLRAKLIAGALIGFAFGVIVELFSLIVGLPLLASKGVDVQLGGEAVDLVFGTMLATTLCGVLGVSLGTVIRNQVVAIVTVFVTLLIVEQILTASTASRWPEVQKFFPLHAITAVVDPDAPEVFSRPGGAAVLAGYILVLAGVGGRFVLSRDVNSIQA